MGKLSEKTVTYGGRARQSAAKFNKEFRNHLLVAVSAALGFLIALSWREPISQFVDIIIEKMGIVGEAIIYQFLAAILVTFICVIGLMIVTKWQVEEGQEEKPK